MAEPTSLIQSAIIIFTGAIISLIQNILESQNIFPFKKVCNISALSDFLITSVHLKSPVMLHSITGKGTRFRVAIILVRVMSPVSR